MKINYFMPCTWQEIRENVRKVNPVLCDIIDRVDPSDKYNFIKVRYHFGQYIVSRSEFQLPVSTSKTVPISDPSIPNSIKKLINYSDLPISLILNKSVEVFYESDIRVMPTKLFRKGALFGLWELLDKKFDVSTEELWNITAGARTAFMLSKISDNASHMKLRRHYSLSNYQPSGILDHHKIFSEIAQSNIAKSNWHCDLILFSSNWVKNTNKLAELNYFWLQEAWRQSFNCRKNMSFNKSWETFSAAVSSKNIRPNPLTINIIKHLLLIIDGLYPAFSPATDEETIPRKLLHSAYKDIYQLKNTPLIMEPSHLFKKNKPVYYSFQLETLLEYAPNVNRGKTIITDLRELITLIRILENFDQKVKGKFKFFHKDADENHQIQSSNSIPCLDSNFPKDVAHSSPFFKGCIQAKLDQDRSTPLLSDPCI